MMSYIIAVLLIMAMIGMAKHGRGRRRGRWTADMKRVQVDGAVALGTLANNVVIGGNLTEASNEAYRVLSIRFLWSLRGLTAGEGPIVFGVAHGDYTDAEIEECLENDSSLQRGDKIAQEQSNRLVRRIGVFAGAVTDETINDGKAVTTRLNWAFATGQILRVWAWNKSGLANLTTGGQVSAVGPMTIRFT